NTTLGRFSLDGIPSAPRGVPQIEVTFDIDANGIVNVSATDKGTGKEQHITITSSSNMSKEDIDKAVKEAEKYAEEDRIAKEAVDTKNQAENLIFQSEKTMTELGDKIDASEKAEIQSEIDRLKETVKNGSVADIKAGTEELQKKFYAMSEKLYKQQASQGQQDAQGQAGTQNADGTYNADFTDMGKE
ncbi:MAG: Hsp70 family protein, partial [Clostridia bacterium]|nr:Hsp70 family protein [Clostridia bacterium]